MWLRFLSKNAIATIQELAVQKAIARVVAREADNGFVLSFCVPKFETLLSNNFESRVIATGSGTDALIISLKALNIGPGDEVIVPAFGCIPIASSVSWVGAKPIFVDIQEVDYAIAPEKMIEKMTSKTRAIIIAHLFGQVTRAIYDVLQIAKQHKIFVVEDAAQSFGAKIENNGEWKNAGTIGDIGCLSFSSKKLFSAPGNGGAVIAKEPHLIEEIRRMRLFGSKTRDYDYPTIGINANLEEINAAALLAKLPFLEYWLEHRRKLADYYTKTLSDIRYIILPCEEKGTKRIWYRYVVRVKKRDQLFEYLRTTFHSVSRLRPMIHYPVPLPYFSAFESGYSEGSFPISDQMSSEVMSLPLNNSMSLTDVDRVCEAIVNFFNNM